jgi:hypothetical protein
MPNSCLKVVEGDIWWHRKVGSNGCCLRIILSRACILDHQSFHLQAAVTVTMSRCNPGTTCKASLQGKRRPAWL